MVDRRARHGHQRRDRPAGRRHLAVRGGRANEGFEVAFHGEYREISEPDRLVNTEIYEGAPEGVGVVTTTFTEEGGRTTMSQLCEYGDRKVRDAVIDSGMEGGMQEALDHLEQVAVSLR